MQGYTDITETLSQDEIEKLNSSDRQSAYKAYQKLRRTIMQNECRNEDEFDRCILENGVKMFIPHGYASSQAFSNRYEHFCTESAILCDYDGCSRIDSLRDLVREARRCMTDIILCSPSVAYAGSGCVDDPDSLSSYEKAHMIPIYHANYSDGQWGQIVIAYDIYKTDVPDIHGFIHHLNLDRFFAAESSKRRRQYVDFSKGRMFDPANELYEVQAPSSLVSPVRSDNDLSDEQYQQLNACALECAVSALVLCDESLSKKHTTPEEVTRDIDRIHDAFSFVFKFYRQIVES